MGDRPAESDRERDPQFSDVLGEAVEAVEEQEIPYALFGSIAAVTHGRPGRTGDVDFLVRKPDAPRALAALERAGFDTKVDNPNWIYKATKGPVGVDIIFFVKGEIHLDEEMVARAVDTEFAGQKVRVVGPEDAMVIEALSHDPQVPSHWDNAVAILAAQAESIDWDYVVRRARYGARRVLSLLIYAQSVDLVVPDATIRRLYDMVYRSVPIP